MGAAESGPSGHQQHQQAETMMQNNLDIAKRLSKDLKIHRQKSDGILHQIGKDMFTHVMAPGNPRATPNRTSTIEIDGVTYELLDLIGKGGFGQVYKAQMRQKDRIVAVKVMKNDPSVREEVENEIHFLNLTKKLSIQKHPVIHYYGSKVTNQTIHIAMELAACDLLKFWIDEMQNANPRDKFFLGITVIIYVLRALTFLEKLEIIHGDIKPQNLVIVPKKNCFYIKLIDFGTMEKMDPLRAHLTVDASKAYSNFFVSPEFFRRNTKNLMARHLHKKSDAWAAGVMFYYFFLGRLPWKNESEYDNFCNDPDAQDIVVPDSGGFKAIIELLLKKNPDDRASAKSTLKQMKGHPALRTIIDSLNDTFCPIYDVLNMRVPDDIRDELGNDSVSEYFHSMSNLDTFSETCSARSCCARFKETIRRDARTLQIRSKLLQVFRWRT